MQVGTLVFLDASSVGVSAFMELVPSGSVSGTFFFREIVSDILIDEHTRRVWRTLAGEFSSILHMSRMKDLANRSVADPQVSSNRNISPSAQR